MNKKNNINSSKKINEAINKNNSGTYFGMSNSFLIIIFTLFISLIFGAIGCALMAPFFINPQAGTDVKVSDYNWGNSGLIIRDPKTVVVNQDLKVEESINSVSASMIKFYSKLSFGAEDSLEKKLDSNKYYVLKDFFSAGVLMSNDGWVLALWPSDDKELDLKKIISNYEGLSSDGKVYSVDKAVLANKTVANKLKSKPELVPVLIHLVNASNLPVRSLAKPEDLKIGQSVFSYYGGSFFDYGFLADRNKGELLRSSEDSTENLVLDLGEDISTQPGFIFNLAGDLLAWQTSAGKVSPVYNLTSRLNSLFKLQKFSEPYFGVNYYNLSDIKIPGFNYSKGALIYSSAKDLAVAANSPAEKAGLKKGDLILEVNGEMVSSTNDLSLIIQKYLPGQELLISYSRSGVNAETSLKLSELK